MQRRPHRVPGTQDLWPATVAYDWSSVPATTRRFEGQKLRGKLVVPFHRDSGPSRSTAHLFNGWKDAFLYVACANVRSAVPLKSPGPRRPCVRTNPLGALAVGWADCEAVGGFPLHDFFYLRVLRSRSRVDSTLRLEEPQFILSWRLGEASLLWRLARCRL